MTRHRVRVGPLPPWLDHDRLLGEGPWIEAESGTWTSTLETKPAADLDARLRKSTLAGRALHCLVDPPLPRAAVRAARLDDARRRRDTTPGFTRKGARVDEEGRWSLTPELLALELGKRVEAELVIDAGCGVGGNTIGFARAGHRVIAIERDPQRLAHARHNAELYGVAERVTFVEGDALALVPRFTHSAGLVFVDPPWGRDWAERELAMRDFPLVLELLELLRAPAIPLWAKLPPACSLDHVGGTWEAWFGAAAGDWRRVKFLLWMCAPQAPVSAPTETSPAETPTEPVAGSR